MSKPTEMQEIIYDMLTENTGAHLLDSGGSYGRNHERNRKKTIQDFIDEPAVRLDLYKEQDGTYSIDRIVSVFHYLSDGLCVDERTEAFNAINVGAGDWAGGGDLWLDAFDADLYGVGLAGAEWLIAEGFEPDKYYNGTINTYNGDSDLSQVLQYTWLLHDESGESYVLVQIHGGCDVRGGYTYARLFAGGYENYLHEYIQEYRYREEIADDIKQGYLEGDVFIDGEHVERLPDDVSEAFGAPPARYFAPNQLGMFAT